MNRQKCILGSPSFFMNCQSKVWPYCYDNNTYEIFKYQQAQLELGNNGWKYESFNTGVGSLSCLQGIFPTQGLNPILHCGQICYQLSCKGSPRILKGVAYPFASRSSWPRYQTGVSYIAGRFFTNWAMRETHIKRINHFCMYEIILFTKKKDIFKSLE